ncbi:hypothetical protein K1719_005545 [Acacia pycnantha]|nr:hypothetical protein K1719_005545 [Acacia pycnantha]
MEEFVWGLQIDEKARKPESEDVFMHEDEEADAADEVMNDETGKEWCKKDIVALQKKGTSDELEKQVGKLKRELELQNKEKVALEAWVNEAEKRILDLNLKLADLQVFA